VALNQSYHSSRMTLAELQATERDRILEIARRHAVTSVKVFGSFVRNQARPDSDLDLLIEAGPGTTPSFPGGSYSRP
jgi:predicted nucleotidyltransferase